MNEDIRPEQDVEDLLWQATPRGAPGQLRVAVLEAVSRELASRRPVRWDRWYGSAACTLLALGISANVLVGRIGERRLARLMGPEPIPQAIVEYAEMVASITDRQTGRLWQERLLAICRLRPQRTVPQREIWRVRRLLNEWALSGEDWFDADALESREMDRGRSGDPFRGAVDCRGGAQLAGQYTA